MGLRNQLGIPDISSIEKGIDLAPGRAQSGFGSRMYMAEQTDYDIPITDLSAYYGQTWEGVNWGVVQNANPIVPTRIRANRSPIPNERGRVDVSGGISMQGNVYGMLPFWKLATMTPGTKFTTGNGSGMIPIGAVAGGRDTGLGRDNVANQYQYDYKDVVVFGKAAVDGTAASGKTVNLSEATQGIGNNGSALTGLTTAIPAEQVPTRLEITIGGTPKARTTSDHAVMIISGKDQNGIPITDEVDFTEPVTGGLAAFSKKATSENADAVVSRTTRVHFASVDAGADSIVLKNFADNSTLKVLITAKNDKKVHRYTIQDNILEGVTLYIIKGGIKHEVSNLEGGIPNVYAGCKVNSATWGFGETMTMDLDFIGRNAYARVTPARIAEFGRNLGKIHIPPDASRGTTPKKWNFKGATDETYVGWEGGVQIREPGSDWITIPCSDLSMSVNHNLTHPERYWFRRWHVPPIPSDQMEVMIDGTVDYATAQGLDFLQLENIDLEARMISFYRPNNGPESFVRVDARKAQINAALDPSVGGSGDVTQSFSLKCSTRDANAPDLYDANTVVIDVQSEQSFADIFAHAA